MLHFDLECSPERLQEMRLAAVNEVLAADGKVGLVRLAEKTAYPGLVGQTAAAATTADEQKRSLLAFFLDHADGCLHTMVRCFVEAIFKEEGISLADFIAKYGGGIEGRLFGVFALGLSVCSETWDVVEAHGKEAAAAYWKSAIFLSQHAALVARAVRAMLRHDRVASAVDAIAYSRCAISSEVILETLKRVPPFLNEFIDPVPHTFTYRIERLFEILDSNSDVPDQELVELEIVFFPLLKHTKRSSSAVLRYARQNPEFFVELLRLEFRRHDGEEDDDLKELSEERRKHLFDVSFNILHKFDAIPGLDGTGPQAAQHMRSWISQVLQAAGQIGRREIAEEKIGGALARAPDSKEPWPPDHVCDVIEEFWSDRLASGFRCGCFNKLGFRLVGEGGPDKARAEQYGDWARYRQITHPHVAVLLIQLSTNFSGQARQHALDGELRRQIEY